MMQEEKQHIVTGSGPHSYAIPGGLGPLNELGPPPNSNPFNPANNQLQFADIQHANNDNASSSSSSSVSGSMSSTTSSSFTDSSSLLPHNQSSSDTSSDTSSFLPTPASIISSSLDPSSYLNSSFYQLSYYQRWFDVTDDVMLVRLLKASFPFQYGGVSGGKFYSDEGSKPDLYGPFWITTTLIFLLAAAGNFANYLQFIADEHTPSWNYDFEKVTVGASLFYSWISLVPTLLWCYTSRHGDQKGLVEVCSIMGYSLITLIPVCILSIPNVSLLRWLSLSISFVISSTFLVRNLFADINNKQMWPIIAFVIACNFGIATLTKYYFFD